MARVAVALALLCGVVCVSALQHTLYTSCNACIEAGFSWCPVRRSCGHLEHKKCRGDETDEAPETGVVTLTKSAWQLLADDVELAMLVLVVSASDFETQSSVKEAAKWLSKERAFEEVARAARAELPGVTFAVLNIDEQPELRKTFPIRGPRHKFFPAVFKVTQRRQLDDGIHDAVGTAALKAELWKPHRGKFLNGDLRRLAWQLQMDVLGEVEGLSGICTDAALARYTRNERDDSVPKLRSELEERVTTLRDLQHFPDEIVDAWLAVFDKVMDKGGMKWLAQSRNSEANTGDRSVAEIAKRQVMDVFVRALLATN